MDPGRGKPTPGGPHEGERYLPLLYAAGKKLLAAVQDCYRDKSFIINDAAYVAHGLFLLCVRVDCLGPSPPHLFDPLFARMVVG